MRWSWFLGITSMVIPSFASAQSPADADSVPPNSRPSLELGGFVFSPIVEARVRGEYRRNPLNDGIPGEHAVLTDGTPLASRIPYEDQAVLWERVRLGLSVDKGPVTVLVSMQDVRGFGLPENQPLAGQPTLPVTEPYEAYVDLHTEEREFYFRVGRQAIELGDGQLIGRSFDRAQGRTLDAVRGGVRYRDLDLTAFAAFLRFPGEVESPSLGSGEETPKLKPGAQLYALDATYKVAPYFAAELTALARIVREPLVDELTPGDTFTGAARVFGDYRGIAYSVVGAVQGGRVARPGTEQAAAHFAGGALGRVTWETALPWRLSFGAEGAYATGSPQSSEDGGQTASVGIFDPILPDTTSRVEQSAFYAWSNVIEAGADVGVRPVPEFRSRLGYKFVGLADPNGPWRTGALYPIGQSESNESNVLGHVLFAELYGQPIDELSIGGHYGLMLLGEGARNIFSSTRPGLAEDAAPDFAEVFTVDVAFKL